MTRNITSILIANRGEIASRIIRTCKKMGIRTVAVYSEADKAALYVSEADVAIHIGDPEPNKSYLDVNKLIAAAKRIKADAIHPGYGFLSENSGFARKCAKEGIIFIGPSPEAIDAMGSKSNAKTLMQKHKVPTVPGYQGEDQSEARLIKEAKEVGFPLLLKATAGGGGKGMRIVRSADELEGAIAAAKRESKSAFGDDELIIEKYIESGRHIEFQIFGDQHGNAIHLLERECSIQRRYQKVVEESPSSVMSDELRIAMGEASINAAQALNYDNAGTVEFIYDDVSGDFYFLEVNTRLQVEHPVTEEVTGLDLVQMQIESAQGMPLGFSQSNINGSGYAIEVRLYAENPANDFLPETGRIIKFDTPDVDGLRIESAIQSGSEISIFYDPMIAKLIVHDRNRISAIHKLNYVLRNMVCLGVQTNQDFLIHLTEQEDFINGKYNTHYIADKINLDLFKLTTDEVLHQSCIAASLSGWIEREQKRKLLISIPSGWRNSFSEHQKDIFSKGEKEIEVKYRYNVAHFDYIIGESAYKVNLIESNNGSIRLSIDGLQSTFNIVHSGNQYFVQNDLTGTIAINKKDRLPLPEKEEVAGGYSAPMPSQIIKILVAEEQKVSKGDALMIISSMKMENTIETIEDGIVESIMTTEGANVEAGTVLLKVTSTSLRDQ